MIRRIHRGAERDRLLAEVSRLPRLDINSEVASDIVNIGCGALSPLEGFMGPTDLRATLFAKRLTSGVPWTIPIVLDISRQQANQLGEAVGLWHDGRPLALLEGARAYSYDRQELARQGFGDIETPLARYRLTPLETRVLFEAIGWRTVVGFQTRNVPHLGHEYVQKTALTFVDGLPINPVLGRKKAGDFTDEVILRTYEGLVHHYYVGERAVLATLHTEMHYAGPREAIFHAIVRKNFGCTHFIVGRDHAGVGNYYAPYAAQEIFDDFPDLGSIPLFFTAFFDCRRCASVANDKTCPHGDDVRVQFSGTLLRRLLTERQAPDGLIRPEVADILLNQDNPFVEVNHS